MATFDPRYASVPNAGALPPIGQGALANAWNSGGRTATSSTFPTAMPSKTPVAVPKDTRDYSKDISKTPGMSANMPTLGFNGMTTFPQYSPETMSMTSRKVLESAAKIKQAQQPQNAQQATQHAQVTPEEIASAKASKRLTKRHVDYVVSLNPETDPVTIVKGLISKGYAIEGLNAPVSEAQQPSAPVQQAQEQPSEAGRSMTFMESMGKSAKSIVGGAGVVAGSVPKLVGGVVDIGEELLGGGDGIGEKIKGAGEALQEKSLDFAGIEGDFTRGAAKFVSDVGLPIGGIASAGSKAMKGTAGAQKASGIISKVPGAGKVASAATSPIGKAAGVGALGTSMVPGADLGDITAGAAISGAIPFAGKALKPAKEIVSGIIGKASGQGSEAIKTAYASGHKKAFQEPQNFEKIVDTMKGGLQNIKANRKALYGASYDAFEEQSKKLGSTVIDDVVQSFDDALANRNIKAVINPKSKNATIVKVGDKSPLVTDKSQKAVVSEVYKELADHGGKMRLDQMDAFRKFVDDKIAVLPQGSQARTMLIGLRDTIKSSIEKRSPAYAKMNENYSRITSAIEDIEKTLSLGGKSNAQTAITKLTQVLKDKQNDDFKRSMVNQLERLSGDRDIMTRIASASMDNWVPSGLIGVATGGVAGAASVGGLASLKTLLGMLVLGSPKLHKELAIGLGKSRSFVTNLANKYQKSVELAKKTPGTTKKAIETAEKVGGAVKGAIKNVNMSAPKAASAIPRSMVGEDEEGSYQGIINRR